MVTTAPKISASARKARRGKSDITSLAAGTAVVVCTLILLAVVHLIGCATLDSLDSQRVTLKSEVNKTRRENLRMEAGLDKLYHPDRLSRVAEGAGMTPIVPSELVSCPPPARMVAAGALSGEP